MSTAGPGWPDPSGRPDPGRWDDPPSPPPSRIQGWLLALLGVLVLALIGGIVFVLVSDDDSGDDTATDDTTTTSTTTSTTAPPTTTGDTASEQIVNEFADAITTGSSGRFTHEQAVCMARGILDTIGLRRLAEVRIQAGRDKVNPVDVLTKDEQEKAFGAMRRCVPGGDLDQAPTSG